MKFTRAKNGPREACALVLILSLTGLALAQEGWMAARAGPDGKDLNTVYFADSKRGWIAGDGGFMSSTRDGGRSWSQQPVATGEAINDVYFRNKEDGYFLAGNTIFSTDDGGQTWRELRRLTPEEFGGAEPELYSIRFAGKKKGWVVGSLSRRDRVVDGLVYHTKDGGVSWQRQRVPTRSELIHLDFSDDDHGWIVGAGGTILHTADGGLTWALQRSNATATLYHVNFRNKRTGWAVGERGVVLRSIDGGETWLLAVTVPVRNTLLSVQFIDDERGWIVGRGGVILRSEDGGQTWVRQESNTKQNLYALFVDKKSGWAVGGDGTVLRYER